MASDISVSLRIFVASGFLRQQARFISVPNEHDTFTAARMIVSSLSRVFGPQLLLFVFFSFRYFSFLFSSFLFSFFFIFVFSLFVVFFFRHMSFFILFSFRLFFLRFFLFSLFFFFLFVFSFFVLLSFRPAGHEKRPCFRAPRRPRCQCLSVSVRYRSRLYKVSYHDIAMIPSWTGCEASSVLAPVSIYMYRVFLSLAFHGHKMYESRPQQDETKTKRRQP